VTDLCVMGWAAAFLLAVFALVTTAALGVFACNRHERQRTLALSARDAEHRLERALAVSEGQRSTLTALLAQERHAALGTLTAGLTHELNNALSALISNLEFVQEDDEALADATQAAELLKNMLQDLSGAARPIAPQSGCDAAHAVQVALRLGRANWPRNLAVHCRISERLPPVVAATSVLVATIVHLVQNAVDASREGSAIQVHVDLAGAGVRVRIDDGGDGIPTDDMGLVFEPFFSTREGRLGLGLPYCRQAAEELGGSLTLMPSERGGTLAQLTLPTASPGALH